MYKLIVFIPQTHLEIVKNALFKAGAGRYKNYDSCSFDLKGIGQFRPLEGANPHIGKNNQIELVEETRVETICQEQFLKPVLKALIASHPYEEPAYDLIKLVSGENLI